MNTTTPREGFNLDIAIAPDMWTPSGPEDDPTARLSLFHPHALAVCGLQLHLEAYAVELDAFHAQNLVTERYDGWRGSDGLYAFFCPDGPFLTTEITGRRYVIFASPYGD